MQRGATRNLHGAQVRILQSQNPCKRVLLHSSTPHFPWINSEETADKEKHRTRAGDRSETLRERGPRFVLTSPAVGWPLHLLGVGLFATFNRLTRIPITADLLHSRGRRSGRQSLEVSLRLDQLPLSQISTSCYKCAAADWYRSLIHSFSSRNNIHCIPQNAQYSGVWEWRFYFKL